MTDRPVSLESLGLRCEQPAPLGTTARFPDGGAYRIEIPSVETLPALDAVLDEAAARGVPIHRVSQGSGVTLLSEQEITELLGRCDAAGVELCLFLGPRASWGLGGGRASTAGGGGARARGAEQLRDSLKDAERAVELGVRCLLVADEGVLWTLHRARTAGLLPAGTTLKASALIGPVNPAAYAVQEMLGADSINVPSDLTLSHLTEIRRVSAAPMDMYIEAPDDLGGYVRMYEVAELIRRGAPLYLKFGLSKAPGIYPYGHHMRDPTLATARERVRRGRLALDLLARHGADGDMAPLGSRLPGTLRRFDTPA
jgi:hypothetical protein